MPRALSYARKSTDNTDGVDRQIEFCHDFIRAQGWEIGPDFRDNDVSGAEFNRPGLNALLAALRAGDVLVMMDASRLGRDIWTTGTLQERIFKAGVRMFFYQTGQEVKWDTPTDELKSAIDYYGAKDFRYQIKLKTTMALRKKADQGHVTGGRIYGYRNIKQQIGADGKHSHVLREPDPIQAAIVRRIFTQVAEGYGCRRVARMLNEARVPHPQAAHVCKPACKHKPYVGWATTTVRGIVGNRTYLGVVRYAGKLVPPIPAVVAQDLWDAAHARLAATRQTYTGHGKAVGHLGILVCQSHHLLGGLARCGGCSGSLTPLVRQRYYGCLAAYKQGRLCKDKVLIPYGLLTQAVLSHFEPERLGALLKEELYRAPVDMAEAADILRRNGLDREAQRHILEDEILQRERELGNLTAAIKLGGGDVRVLVGSLRDTERRLDDARTNLADAEAPEEDLTPEEMAVIEYEVNTLWEAGQPSTVENTPDRGHAVLSRLLSSPVRVTVARNTQGQKIGWDYFAEADLGRLLKGRIAPLSKSPGLVGESYLGIKPAYKPSKLLLQLQGRIAA